MGNKLRVLHGCGVEVTCLSSLPLDVAAAAAVNRFNWTNDRAAFQPPDTFRKNKSFAAVKFLANFVSTCNS